MATINTNDKIQIRTDPEDCKKFKIMSIEMDLTHKALFSMMVSTFRRVIDDATTEEVRIAIREALIDEHDIIPPLPADE